MRHTLRNGAQGMHIFKVGNKVRVFNQAGNDWSGQIKAINKFSARVSVTPYPSGATRTVFTNHTESKVNEIEHYLVPFIDLTLLPDD